MEGKKLWVRDMITKSLKKINTYPGGNKLFFQNLGMSRSMVSAWKSGRYIASDDVQMKIIAAATKTIATCEDEKRNKESAMANLINHFESLIGDRP